MLNFIVRRTLLAFFTVWVISMIAFVTIQLPPGDYADTYVSSFTRADAPAWVEEMKENIRREYGLDKPVFVQYGKWAFKILRGDFGNSYAYNQPVGDVIQERLLMTIILVLATALFAWSLSIPIGIYTAVRQHSVGDYTVSFVGFLGLTAPTATWAIQRLTSPPPECNSTDAPALPVTAITFNAQSITSTKKSASALWPFIRWWSAVVNSTRACRTQEPVYEGAGVPGGIRTRDMLLRRSPGLSAVLM